jgi:hypothetical protein
MSTDAIVMRLLRFGPRPPSTLRVSPYASKVAADWEPIVMGSP